MEACKKNSPVDPAFIPYKDDAEEPRLVPKNDIPVLQIYLLYASINAEVLLSWGEESKGYEGSNLVKAKIIRHFCDEEGNIMGNANI